MVVQTADPMDEYQTHDELGHHEISVPNATAAVNRDLYQMLRQTRDRSLGELFAYVHGHRDTVPLDGLDRYCRESILEPVPVAIEDRGTVERYTICRGTDTGLEPEHESVLATAHRVVVAEPDAL